MKTSEKEPVKIGLVVGSNHLGTISVDANGGQELALIKRVIAIKLFPYLPKTQGQTPKTVWSCGCQLVAVGEAYEIPFHLPRKEVRTFFSELRRLFADFSANTITTLIEELWTALEGLVASIDDVVQDVFAKKHRLAI